MEICHHLNMLNSKDQKDKSINILKRFYSALYCDISKIKCKDCPSSFYLHVCLTCYDMFCYNTAHFNSHFTEKKHILYLNIEKRIIYCHQCKCYIINKFFKEINEYDFVYDGSGTLNLNNYNQISDKEYMINEKFYKKMPCMISKGAVNLGNTCYMNSLLQALIHNKIFKGHLLNYKHSKEICEKNEIKIKENGNLNSDYLSANVDKSNVQNKNDNDDKEVENKEFSNGMALKTNICILCCVYDIIIDVYSSSSSLVFTNFIYSLCKHDKGFIGSNQQDVHEFFLKICDILHKSHITYNENKNLINVFDSKNKNSLSCQNNEESNISGKNQTKFEEIEDLELKNGTKLEKTTNKTVNSKKIYDSYIGKKEKRIENCDTKNCRCVAHSVFQGIFNLEKSCLSCSFKSSNTENFFNISLALEKNKTSLQEKQKISTLLKNFFSEESTEYENNCEYCRNTNKNKIQYSIEKVPQILVLHLKRFDLVDGKIHKITSEVDIEKKINLNEHNFKLYAVISHSGNTSSGHYIAYIENLGNFVCFDDEEIKDVKIREISKDAYLVFYEYVEND